MRQTRSQAIHKIETLATPLNTASNVDASIIQDADNKQQLRGIENYSPTLSDDSALSSPPSDLDLDTRTETLETSSYFASATPTATPSRKRKRGDPENGKLEVKTKVDKMVKVEVKVENEEVQVRQTVKKVTKPKVYKYTPPSNWRALYDTIKAIRVRIPAVIDHLVALSFNDGKMDKANIYRAANDWLRKKDQRFQTLIALMLSSQTKDTVTGATIRKLQKELPGGLTLQSILELEPDKLNILIGSVGFHNRKTEYIKQTAVILRDNFDGDIPETIEGMCSLPGVGPKMAHLLSSSAWNKTMGIGVDTHVHRLSNLFRWVPNTPNPEITRLYLESWLPHGLWHEINWLLVGYGQTFSRKEENIFYKDFHKAYRDSIKTEVKDEVKEECGVWDGKRDGDGMGIMSMVDEWVDMKMRKAEEVKAKKEADIALAVYKSEHIEDVLEGAQEDDKTAVKTEETMENVIKAEPISPEKLRPQTPKKKKRR